jgi:transcriptional regulator with XRE-family HTH domain
MAGRRRYYSTEPFGPTMERLMQDNALTYRGLAEKTGLSAGYLNHLVPGNRPLPSTEVIGRLARALGVESEHFLEVRLRTIAEQLQTRPEMIDRLFKRLAT